MKSKLTVFVALVVFPASSFGLDSFSYSGRLVNSNGSPVTDEVDLRFDLRSTQNISDILCSKTVSDVPLSQGIFNVKLQFLPADCENNSIQSIMESIPSNHNLVYQVTDITNSRTYSQQAIYSVPSSFMANFAKSLSNLGATDGQVLMWDAATSKWIPGNAGSGNGTVTGIQTGSGLTGGPIDTTGTIAIAAGGVEDSHLQGNINPAKLAGTRDATMYLKGNNTWSSLETDVLSTLLNSFAVITGSTVSSSDNLLQGLGKLQGQVTDLSNNKLDKTGGTLVVGTIDGVPTPVSPSQIVNKSYVDDLVGGVNDSQWIDNASGIHYNLGDVGIGTSTPSAKLQVTGDIRIGAQNPAGTGTLPDYGNRLYFSGGPAGAWNSDNSDPLWMGRFNNGNDQSELRVNIGDGAAVEDKFVLGYTNTNWYPVFVVQANGNVGIGTAIPGAKLEVAGQVKITGGDPGVGKILTSDADGLASWSTPGGSTPTGAAGGELSGTYPNPTIANSAITDAKVAAGANIDQAKIANLTTDLGNKQTADSDLTALAGLGTTGVMVRTGAGTATTRSIVGTTNRATVVNGDGVSGNPTINVSTALLPSPVAGDAGKFLKASGADTASWGSFLSTDITTALGFTPVNKAGDSISSGTFDFTGTSTVRVKDPVAATDAANKQYVDNKLVTGSNQWGESSGNVYRLTGNVGVGTSSPDRLLHVNGPMRLSPAALPGSPIAGDLVVDSDASNEMKYYNGSSWIPITSVGANTILNGGNSFGASINIGSNDAQSLMLKTNNTTAMTINSNGDFGIGGAPWGASDYTKLQIHQDGTGIKIPLSLSNSQAVAVGVGTSISFRLNDGGGVNSSRGAINVVADNTGSGTSFNTSMRFSTYGGGVSLTEKVRITSSGNVGIGTLSPRSKLEVAGGIQIGTDAVTCDATKVGTIRYNSGNVEYCNGGTSWQAFGVSGGESFANGSSGLAPNWSSAAGVHTLNIPLASTAGVTAGLLSKSDYDSFSAKLGTTLSSGRILVGNGSSVATAVTPSGDVSMTNAGAFTVTKLQGRSVATTAPSLGSFLKWNNTLSNWEPFIFSGCSGASQVLHYILATDTWSCDTISVTSATGTLPIANGGTGATTANAALNNLLPSQTGNSGKFLSTNGTTTSWTVGSGDFMKDGSVAMTGQFKAIDGNSTTPSITFADDTGTGFFRVGNYAIGLRTTAHGNLWSMGNSIISTQAGGAGINRVTGTADAPSFMFQNDANTGMFSPALENLAFTTDGVEKVRITQTGDVGIGTTAPGAKLEVAGQVKITGGTPGVGKVLTSDSTGLATWVTPSGGGDFMKDGSVTMTGSLKLADGTAALPSLTLGSDSDTGFFKYTENMFGISLGGVGRYYYTFDSTFGNARLGINTIPTRTLHVKQQTVSGVVATFEAPAGAALELKRTGSSMYIQQDAVGNLLVDDNFNEETTPSLFVSITNGNVGIGTSTDTYKLNVGGDINSTTALRIAGTQVCTSAGCTSSSDERLKENIRPLENALEKILKLQGVEYNYIDKEKFGDNHQVGVIAQDVEKVFPEVVLTDEKSGFKSVAYDHLVAPLIEAFKTLNERQITQSRDIASLEALKIENEELRKENEEIKARLKKIEEALNIK